MRKTKERVISFVLLLVLVCGTMTGCGSSNSSDTAVSNEKADAYDIDYGFDAGGVEESVESYEEEAKAESYDSAAGAAGEESGAEDVNASSQTTDAVSSQTVNPSQKIIKTYDYYYETEHFDNAHAYLKEQVKGYNGYIASSQISNSGYETSYRTLYLTARIPAESSDAFVNELGQLGTVVRQSETAEDVTLQYSDTESRIASLKTEQERLNELLGQADSLETIIALEQRMTEVRYELESYESQKRLYDNLISYSTIEITLEEVRYTVAVDDSTFFSRISSGLQSSFRDIAEGLVIFVEWVIINCPYFILIVVVLFVIVKIICAIIRRIIRKIREKTDNRNQTKVNVQPVHMNQVANATTQPVIPNRAVNTAAQPPEADQAVKAENTVNKTTQQDNMVGKENSKR